MSNDLYDAFLSLNSEIPCNVTGVRLQPLINIYAGKIIAYEVLSEVALHNAESFFLELTDEDVLNYTLWQMKALSWIEDSLWYNLPVSVLLNKTSIVKLLSMPLNKNKVIEIQDPINIVNLNAFELENFKSHMLMLKNNNYNVWLDDLKSELIDPILLTGLKFDGVKIDRVELRKNYDCLRSLVQKAMRCTSDILVEGIENKDDLIKAQKSGAGFGQGFLWGEYTICIN